MFICRCMPPTLSARAPCGTSATPLSSRKEQERAHRDQHVARLGSRRVQERANRDPHVARLLSRIHQCMAKHVAHNTPRGGPLPTHAQHKARRVRACITFVTGQAQALHCQVSVSAVDLNHGKPAMRRQHCHPRFLCLGSMAGEDDSNWSVDDNCQAWFSGVQRGHTSLTKAAKPGFKYNR